jgi:hypothetical protein
MEVAATDRSSAVSIAASNSSIPPDRELQRGQEGRSGEQSQQKAQSERPPALQSSSSR